MAKEDLDEKFKAPDDPLRLVFVCAMWITGFDVPTCSTVYIDKPMKNDTLMQTIARANRVAPGKPRGLIVDYVGVFRNLKEALAIYAKPRPGVTTDPIQGKEELVEPSGGPRSGDDVAGARSVYPADVLRVSGFERQAALRRRRKSCSEPTTSSAPTCASSATPGSCSGPSCRTRPRTNSAAT